MTQHRSSTSRSTATRRVSSRLAWSGMAGALAIAGDPRRVPGRSFDKGTDPDATGVFPRPASESLARFAKRFRSYCDTGDPFCAGGNNISAHLDYPQKYNKVASAFVTSRLHAAGIH